MSVVQEFDSRGVSGIDFLCWVMRRADRISVLGKRWCGLEAGVGLIAEFCFVVRCHWMHVAMWGTGWSRDNRKMAV
jgi:hypothetical protein